MTYQPDLYVRNIKNASAKEVYKVVKQLGFGKIDFVEIEGYNAIVTMNMWDMKMTSSTRLLLSQGKPLLLYHSPTEFWKVYSYENRFMEEEQEKKQKRIQKQKLKLKKQKERELIEREKREQKEREIAEEYIEKERQEQAKKHHHIYQNIDYGNAAELYTKNIERMRRFRK